MLQTEVLKSMKVPNTLLLVIFLSCLSVLLVLDVKNKKTKKLRMTYSRLR